MKTSTLTVLLLAAAMAWAPLSSAQLQGNAVGPERPTSYPLADVVISLERTRLCPNYKVVIHGDGRVVYDGGQCPGAIGHREWKVDQKRVIELLEHIYKIRFFDMRSEYSSREVVEVNNGVVNIGGLTLISSGYGGNPGKVITVKIGDYEKRVHDPENAYSPQDLVALSAMIEKLAEAAKQLE